LGNLYGNFFGYLWYSYKYLIASIFPTGDTFTLVLVSLGVAIFILRLVGETSGAVMQATNGQISHWFAVPITFFPAFLLTIFAVLPTSTWAVLGPEVIKRDVTTALEKIRVVRASVEDWLRVDEYERTKTRVDALRRSLLKKIDSPAGGNFCGVGAAALKLVENLKKDLPNVYVIPGTSAPLPCRDRDTVSKIVQSYDKTIQEQLERSNLATQYNILTRVRVVADVQSGLDVQIQGLTVSLSRLQQITTFVLDPSFHKESSETLRSANNVYSAKLGSIKALTPNHVPESTPAALDISASQSIGSSYETLKIIWNLPTTFRKIFVVISSIFLDILAVITTWWYRRSQGLISRKARVRAQPDAVFGNIYLLNR
jgi:hypothetical protein